MQSSPQFRTPAVSDGVAIWQLARATGVLEPNSAYAYLLLCQDFADTCLLALDRDRLLGFVTAYRPPTRPDAVFVWQIGVDPSAQGRGIGKQLLLRLLKQPGCEGVRYLEATVGVGNEASRKLFQSVARELNCACEVQPWFIEAHFPPPLPDAEPHEDEPLYRIGPWQPHSK